MNETAARAFTRVYRRQLKLMSHATQDIFWKSSFGSDCNTLHPRTHSLTHSLSRAAELEKSYLRLEALFDTYFLNST